MQYPDFKRTWCTILQFQSQQLKYFLILMGHCRIMNTEQLCRPSTSSYSTCPSEVQVAQPTSYSQNSSLPFFLFKNIFHCLYLFILVTQIKNTTLPTPLIVISLISILPLVPRHGCQSFRDPCDSCDLLRIVWGHSLVGGDFPQTNTVCYWLLRKLSCVAWQRKFAIPLDCHISC